MKYSKVGLTQLTEPFESCRLVAYQDVKGVWTIGWGHTGPDVQRGLVWSKETSDVALLNDTQHAENCVNQCVTVPLTQGEFDALVDFTFNVGCSAFTKSTMLIRLNLGDYQGAAEQFERWVFADGKKVAGLLRRRLAEKEMFEGATI